jgi:hypothetical protein
MNILDALDVLAVGLLIGVVSTLFFSWLFGDRK